ncbi:MAG: glycosyltransferase family 1 protein [Candidatus Omnitrophica bacterium]|nr:glycosyltransferase family 1 protein [Candidatus Omnitrophota bacterium]
MSDLGHVVFPFDTECYFPSKYRGIHTLIRKIAFGPRLWRLNNDIIARAKEFNPDLIWVDKGLLIDPKTLKDCKRLPNSPILIHYSPDDMMNLNNQSRFYLRSIPLYDIHITTKTPNIEELKGLRAKRVYFMDNAYCPAMHRPVPIADVDRKMYGGYMGFIGSYEKERSNSMIHVAKSGLQVRIWGPGWENCNLVQHQNLLIENRSLWREEYAQVICSTELNLCFLRKVNRDTQTTRSIEIPACGGFMVAERTDEHLRLFKEDEEAVFFSSDVELVEKLRYYIKRPEERRRIARAGRDRCLKSGYSNENRLKVFFQELGL